MTPCSQAGWSKVGITKCKLQSLDPNPTPSPAAFLLQSRKVDAMDSPKGAAAGTMYTQLHKASNKQVSWCVKVSKVKSDLVMELASCDPVSGHRVVIHRSRFTA